MKPVGLFDPGPTPPAWASFGQIADNLSDEEFVAARELSERRGFSWVLALGCDQSPATPIGPHASLMRARLERLGLWPHVIAVNVHEEWYERWQQGAFEADGLPASAPWGVDVIRDWLGRQHAAVKAVMPVSIVWITTRVNARQPVPAYTDAVAVDAYVPMGQTFASSVAPALTEAEAHTALPLVLVPQWFTGQGWSMPTDETIAAYAAWAERPRWIATWGFTWRNRPTADLVGLESLPVHATVRRALGVQ